jgi:hypothetical protein
MTANLPDNVTTETVYTVRSDSHMDARVHVALDGSVWITQAEDGHVIVPTSAIPGLIAALSAAAGLDVPTAPALPAYVIDGDGARHELASDGTYRLCLRDGTHGHIRRTLEYIRAEIGIRSEG